MRDRFLRDGCLWMRGLLDESDLEWLDRACEIGARPGQRLNLSEHLSRLNDTAHPLMQGVSQVNPDARVVRAVAFNKSEGSNWGVPWHQDRVITVQERRDVAGFGNWSRKAGQWHCEPPLDVLQSMLFVRVHLDDTDTENGAMEFARGSHASGVVSAKKAETVANKFPHELCTARRGDVLILNMLTLHRSLPARVSSRRRTLRLDFSDQVLPHPLNWLI